MVIDAIKNRRSIRQFKQPFFIPKKQMFALLEAAMLAPSACNTRPWRFIVVEHRDGLEKLSELHDYGKMIKTASSCIVVVGLPALQEGHEKDLPKGFLPQDCAAATQNILIQAEAMGLGTCWCGVYPKEPVMKRVSEFLKLLPGEIPFCLIAVGEKDQDPEQRGKYDELKVAWV